MLLRGFPLICEKNGLHRGKLYDDHGALRHPPAALVTETAEEPVGPVCSQGREEIHLAHCRNRCRLTPGWPSSAAAVPRVLQWWVATSPMERAIPRTAKHISIPNQTASHRLLKFQSLAYFRKTIISSAHPFFSSLCEGLLCL